MAPLSWLPDEWKSAPGWKATPGKGSSVQSHGDMKGTVSFLCLEHGVPKRTVLCLRDRELAGQWRGPEGLTVQMGQVLYAKEACEWGG